MKTSHMPAFNRYRDCSGVLMLLAAINMASPAFSQCTHDWLSGEGRPGLSGGSGIGGVTTWDPDGAGPRGPELLLTGGFDGAGDVPARRIALWDGTRWSEIPGAYLPGIFDITVYNGELIAGGAFTTIFGEPADFIARWDGSSWQPLGGGMNQQVRAVTVYNGELIAAGVFTTAGGVPANHIARWDGSAWHPMGAGVPNGADSLFVFNGELLVGGYPGVFRWNGTSFVQMGANLTGGIYAFAVLNGKLIVGGGFYTAAGGPANRVARWDGSAWQPLGGGTSDIVSSLAVYDGLLYAGGVFTSADGVSVPSLAGWDGVSWHSVGGGGRTISMLYVYNGELYAAGSQSQASGTAEAHIMRWNGSTWRYVGGGMNDIALAFETYRGDLIAGGFFTHAGNIDASGLAARTDDEGWYLLGGGGVDGGYIWDMQVYDGNLLVSGPLTGVAGVPVTGIAKWDGQSWSSLGDVSVGRMLLHEGELYAEGVFGPQQYVARWDPLTEQWQPFGPLPNNVFITCLAVHNGQVYAGGFGGIGVNHSVWRWDGSAWQGVGQHLGFNSVQALEVYNGELYLGAYEQPLLRFDGTSWVVVGGGLFLSNDIEADVLVVFDLLVFDGELVVAGSFGHAGAQQYDPDGVIAFFLARWNGTSWSAFEGLENGLSDAAVTLHEHNDELIVGGWFDIAGGRPAGYWARWGPLNPGDLDGDQDVDLSDLATLLSNFGTLSGAARADGDLDADGDVDIADLALLLANFGSSCS